MNTAEADTFKKALEPTLVTDDGMVTEVSVEHPENADAPILVTDDGIDMEVRPVHPANALSRMDLTANVNGPNVTVLGMVMAPEATAAAVLDTETEAVSWSTMRYTTLLAVRVMKRFGVPEDTYAVELLYTTELELSVYILVIPLNDVVPTLVEMVPMLLEAYKFVMGVNLKTLSPRVATVSGITRFVIVEKYITNAEGYVVILGVVIVVIPAV